MIDPNKLRGLILISIALVGFCAYSYILFATVLGIILIKLTLIIIVGIIFFIIGWIGFTLSSNEKIDEEI